MGGDYLKKKVIFTAAFAGSLLPMLMNQFGGAKGVQEISGLICLLNPIGIVSVLMFLFGVWLKFGRRSVGKGLCILGTAGMVVSEVYEFLTWHVMNITGELSIRHSVRLAFPEFYMGLAVSSAMVIVCLFIDKMGKEPSDAAEG